MSASIWGIGSVSASGILARLADDTSATEGAALVAYNAALTYPAGTVGGALANIASADAYDVYSHLSAAEQADVSARTLGINVVVAIRAAFAASKRVRFRAGSYYVGSYTDFQNAIDLSTYGDNITILTEGDVEFVITSLSGIPKVFNLKDNSHFSCGNIRFRDLAYNYTLTWLGATAFYIDSSNTDCSNIRFQNIYSKNMVSTLQVAKRTIHTGYCRGVTWDNIYADDCYYGVNFADYGDSANGHIYAYRCYRPYFVYGVQGHDVSITNRHPRTSSGQVNVGQAGWAGGRDTVGIRVRYQCRECVESINHFVVGTFVSLTPTIIKDCDFTIDTNDSQCPLYILNYDVSGGVETTALCANDVTNITMRGHASAGVVCTGVYTVKPYIKLEGSLYMSDSSVDNVVQTLERGRVATWTTQTSESLAVGAGGYFAIKTYIESGICHVHGFLTIGVGAAIGTTGWRFVMPFKNKSTHQIYGVARAVHGGNNYLAGVLMKEGSADITIFSNGTGVDYSATVPWAWVNTDTLRFSVSFPV